MATTVGKDDDFIKVLKDLIELDRDAADAYQAAIDRLENAEFRSQLAAFKTDHLRHIDSLSVVLRAMGESPPEGGGAKSLLAQGKVVIAGIAGDKQILQAMKSKEDDTNTAYERAVDHPNKLAEAANALDAGRADERRHRDWIEATLARL